MKQQICVRVVGCPRQPKVALFIHIFYFWSETFVELNQDNTYSATF
jgi:hypothetical protein